MAIAGILFDVEDLFFDGTFWHRCLHQMACRIGCRQQFQDLQGRWRTNYLPQVYAGNVEYWDALASFFHSWGLQTVEVRELIAAAQTQLKKAQATLRLFPQVDETLQLLRRQGCKLAVVCNSIHEPVPFLEMLRRIGLRSELNHVLTSRGARRRLPDAEALAQVVSELGLETSAVAYVSARTERLELAALAGLQAIRVQRLAPGAAALSGDSFPTISGLSEIVRALGKLDRQVESLARQP